MPFHTDGKFKWNDVNGRAGKKKNLRGRKSIIAVALSAFAPLHFIQAGTYSV